MRFLFDLFNGTTGVNLSSRSGAVGATWSKQGGGADIILSLANRAMGNANAVARYVASGVPESPDYDGVIRMRKLSAHGEGGVMVRANATVDTSYTLSHVHSTGSWQLRRFNAGVATTLSTVAQAWVLDTDKLLRLRARDINGGATVQLVAVVDGVVVLTAEDSAVGRITEVGRVGLRIHPGTSTLFGTRGYHIGLATAVSLPIDPRPRALKPPDGPLLARILAKAAAERAAERAAILAEVGTPAAWQVTRGGTVYTLSMPQGVLFVNSVLTIPEVVCAPLPLVPLDPGGYRFVNPPTQVLDGTIRDEDDPDGEPYWRANTIEDALAAVRQIVAECVLRGLPA